MVRRMTVLTLRQPDDWHVHLRDGAMLRSVLPYTTRTFGRAIVMPNLKPPVTSVDAAIAYRARILEVAEPGFTPLMTAYLTDATDAAEIERGFTEGVFTACKLYPANATTNSAAGVTDVKHLRRVLEVMQRLGMPLLVHGEVTDKSVDIFDREAVFLDRVLTPLRHDFPSLKVVLEHVTTEEAVEFVKAAGSSLAATITPHHLVFNRSHIFEGGIRPHLYCLPIAKREKHRLALRAAATSGSAKFFLGTDSAPHPIGDKETGCGCAGIFNAPHALEVYAQVFEEEGALGRLEAFASEFGAQFYGLPVNEKRIVLTQQDTVVPSKLDGLDVQPFQAGATLRWTIGASPAKPVLGATARKV